MGTILKRYHVAACSELHMALDLPLRCRCGHMRGVARKVSSSTGLRFTCYCKDCQAFARFLGQADMLDAAGGTDIFHMPLFDPLVTCFSSGRPGPGIGKTETRRPKPIERAVPESRTIELVGQRIFATPFCMC
jgi:hypothetical protein